MTLFRIKHPSETIFWEKLISFFRYRPRLEGHPRFKHIFGTTGRNIYFGTFGLNRGPVLFLYFIRSSTIQLEGIDSWTNNIDSRTHNIDSRTHNIYSKTNSRTHNIYSRTRNIDSKTHNMHSTTHIIDVGHIP